jgi:hypothetical protein
VIYYSSCACGWAPCTKEKAFIDYAAAAGRNHGLQSGSRKRKTVGMSRNSNNLVSSRGISD